MNWLSKKQVIFNSLISGFVWTIIYFLLRPFIKSLFNDVFNYSLHSYSNVEWIFLLSSILISVIIAVYINVKSQTPKKYALSTDNTPDGGDKEKITDFIESIVRPDIKATKKSKYKDIAYKHPRTVYAIIGGWRAGKTTSAIYFLKKINSLSSKGQYYHDTFNFGNVDESISSFFSNISEMTGVKEFKQLGTASTPRFDIGFSFGPFNFKLPYSKNLNVNALRLKAFTKLDGLYTVIIDDVDRLIPSEQVAWVRSIELLSKFEGKIIVIVPINYKEVELGLSSLNISAKYLEKIIPLQNRIAVGVDLDYIANQFGGFENVFSYQDIGATRKYTKFLFALSLIATTKALNARSFSFPAWENQFINNEISAIGHSFSSALSYSEPYQPQTRAAFGPNSEYIVSPDENILFNDGQEFPRHLIVQLATTYMTLFNRKLVSDSEFQNSPLRMATTLNNMSQMQNIFGNVGFIQETRTNIALRRNRGFPSIEGINFWETIAPSAIRNVTNDLQLSNYFTYDIIKDCTDKLNSANDESEEAQILIQLIRANLN